MNIIRYVVMDDAGNYLRGKSWHEYQMSADFNDARLYERKVDAKNSRNAAESTLRKNVALARLSVLRVSLSLNGWETV